VVANAGTVAGQLGTAGILWVVKATCQCAVARGVAVGVVATIAVNQAAPSLGTSTLLALAVTVTASVVAHARVTGCALAVASARAISIAFAVVVGGTVVACLGAFRQGVSTMLPSEAVAQAHALARTIVGTVVADLATAHLAIATHLGVNVRFLVVAIGSRAAACDSIGAVGVMVKVDTRVTGVAETV